MINGYDFVIQVEKASVPVFCMFIKKTFRGKDKSLKSYQDVRVFFFLDIYLYFTPFLGISKHDKCTTDGLVINKKKEKKKVFI